jgi:hypothetical protein
VALAFVTGMTSRELSATARGPQTTQHITGEAQHLCVDEVPTTLDEVPYLGELTVTGTRVKSVL